MSNIDPSLPKLVLEGDGLATLTAISYDKIQAASGGTLTDFRAGSPIAALVEGQVFALSELLYYANLLPEATALELFRLYGARRSLGTFAAGELTVQLVALSDVAFTLPVGYTFGYKGVNLVCTTPLFIPPGSQTGKVGIKCDTVGTFYNADSYGVLITTTGLFNFQSAYNEEPLAGGTDIEAISDCIARMQRTINTRMSLINQADYEFAALEYMGEGSRAICVPKLAADKTTLAFGNVSLFLLNASGLPATTEQSRQLKSALSERAIIGTSVWCHPIELLEVSVDIYVQVESINERISKDIYTAILEYLKPNLYNGGYKVRYGEVAYLARGINGCKSVESVLLNNDAIDLLLPNSWTLPTLTSVTVSQVSVDGYALESVFSPLDAGILF